MCPNNINNVHFDVRLSISGILEGFDIIKVIEGKS